MPSFTVDQANRTLPLVGRIVEDIVRTHRRWQDRVREYELVAASLRAEDPTDAADRVRREVDRLAKEITSFVAELDALGIRFTGFDLGLVDFPSEMDGRAVCLCWHLGEPSVDYWHEVDAGYAGRQPLTPAVVV
ncbi:MAG: DUF2203 family protein [Gemmatimonadaceae bacterium]